MKPQLIKDKSFKFIQDNNNNFDWQYSRKLRNI